MYLFFTLSQIESFSIFAGYNFTTFTDFQLMSILIGVNLFYLCFLFFILTLIYKIFNRIVNEIF